MDSLGTHTSVKLITMFFDCFEVLLIAEQLPALKRCEPFINDYVSFKVEHALYLAQCHIEQQANTRWQ